MFVLLIGFVFIGPCFNASLKQRLSHTDSKTFIIMAHKEENRTIEDDTEIAWYYGSDVPFQKQQGMKKRHSSTKQLKKLKQLYQSKCLNVEYVDELGCNRLFKRIVKKTVIFNSVDRSHRVKTFFDMRICLNGTSVVHYDPDHEICCNGVHTRSSEDMECCGGTLINTKKELCCNDNTLQRKEYFRCCGQTTYDVREHLCCNGFPRKNLPNSACCGDNVYNNKSQVCCFQQLVFDQTKGDSCCRQSVYNSSTSTCCEGVVQPKHGGEVKCCKNTSYYEACFKCVEGNLEPVYNSTGFVCCEGQIHTKRFENFTGCCHRSIYDTRSQHCRDDQVLNGTVWKEDVEPTLPDPTFSNAPDATVTSIVVLGSLTVTTAGLTGFGVCVCKRKKTKESYKRDESEIGHQNNALLKDERNHMSVNSSEESERLTSIDGNMNLDLLNKTPLLNEDNDLKSYYKDTQTQTGPEKTSNCRTIFGKPFDHNFLLGPSNATVQMPDSDVKMTLPQSVLKDNKVEVNCSSFSSISPMRRKLGLSDNERIASPVVEYSLTGIGKLSEHALVVLPFFGSNEELKVRKFKSDEGLHAVVNSEEIPMQGKENENRDIFYIVKDWSVYIYTKSFSGFYCTTCRHRPLRLKAYLFGSYKRFTNPLRFEVRFALYIADELMKFADYSKRMFSNETTEGRIIKKEKLLKLPDTLLETDEIKASLTPTESHLNDWIHKLCPDSTDPIFAAEQVVKLKDVAEKCKDCPHCHLPEHDIPFQLEWYMVNKEGRTPCYTFQCIVFIDVHHLDDGSITKNPVIIDELELRQEDKLPLEDAEFARNIRGIKEYLSRMGSQERDKILRALALKTSCYANNVDEVMQKLHDKYKPKSVLEEVVSAFKENQMFVDLDCLLAYGFIPSYLSSTAVHPVYDAVSEDRDSADEGTEYCSAISTLTQHAAESMGNAEQKHTNLRELTDSQAYRPNINGDDKQLALNKLIHVNCEEARGEISQSLVCSYQHANIDAYKKDEHSPDPRVALGELQSRCLDKSPDSESPTLHAQEHASMEETTLKEYGAERNSSCDG